MSPAEIIYSLVVVVILLTIASIELSARKTGVVAMPTLPWVKRQSVKLLQKHLPENQAKNLYELGSGWGGIALLMGKVFPHAQVTGYEISVVPYLVSKFMKTVLFRRNLSFKKQDFFGTSLADADGIILYMMPNVLEELRPKLEKELQKGTIVISNGFKIKGWKPVETIEMKFGLEKEIFVYRT